MLHLHAVHAGPWFLKLLLVQVPVQIQTSRAVQTFTDHRTTLGVTHLPAVSQLRSKAQAGRTWTSQLFQFSLKSCVVPSLKLDPLVEIFLVDAVSHFDLLEFMLPACFLFFVQEPLCEVFLTSQVTSSLLQFSAELQPGVRLPAVSISRLAYERSVLLTMSLKMERVRHSRRQRRREQHSTFMRQPANANTWDSAELEETTRQLAREKSLTKRFQNQEQETRRQLEEAKQQLARQTNLKELSITKEKDIRDEFESLKRTCDLESMNTFEIATEVRNNMKRNMKKELHHEFEQVKVAYQESTRNISTRGSSLREGTTQLFSNNLNS
ncbi:hypothetical protein F7725_028217 [Dissostichus mawsoni]|uniref:Uncharacterized protein n=1 Tax=Dissostichus mawsoni TaxID=36200 RepID=A0A7J5XGB2_DISMA|nr:hypothetical protein F7725_028217 [Dissostichus mawsoni]